MDDATFALVGAVVGATVGGAITAATTWMNGRKEAAESRDLNARRIREESRSSLAARASEYLAAAYHGVAALRDFALATIDGKPVLEKREVWPTLDRVNRALINIEINDSPTFVRAALELDAAMTALSRSAGAVVHDQDSWRTARRTIIGDLPEKVKDAAKHDLSLFER
ncbi:hypothetical protein [Pengzhenrongella sicca]|uniref:Uncharacterized protein n=1 Tax=Pengzhenrongella sicca TaxID=2819238 RepID=A0A8A4ZDB3_9MICO|nr:hypothetical protein [Pengzhenrongella sicca]QTE28536.1 hypothetical protein J4E96_14330 [Pengzhenrongella sicca]